MRGYKLPFWIYPCFFSVLFTIGCCFYFFTTFYHLSKLCTFANFFDIQSVIHIRYLSWKLSVPFIQNLYYFVVYGNSHQLSCFLLCKLQKWISVFISYHLRSEV